MNKELIFVTVCPDNLYFQWQAEVYITNFLSMGIPPERIHCLFMLGHGQRPSDGLKRIKDKYPVKWYTYFGVQDNYLSTNVFKVLKQHVHKVQDKRIFFHDADMIFLKAPDLTALEALPIHKWYGSDTRGYNSAKYLKKKNEECFRGMCRIVGISPELVESKDADNTPANSQVIGAQYIFDPMTFDFWDKCERDALDMWNYLNTHPSQQGSDPKAKIQKTCLMWSKLWNAWLFGIDTEIRPELSFTFASSKIEKCEEVNILHNAGIVDPKDRQRFSKLGFRNLSPFGQPLDHYSKDFSAWKYVEAIKAVK